MRQAWRRAWCGGSASVLLAAVAAYSVSYMAPVDFAWRVRRNWDVDLRTVDLNGPGGQERRPEMRSYHLTVCRGTLGVSIHQVRPGFFGVSADGRPSFGGDDLGFFPAGFGVQQGRWDKSSGDYRFRELLARTADASDETEFSKPDNFGSGDLSVEEPESAVRLRWLCVPLWIPAAIAAACLFLERVAPSINRRRRRADLCVRCGYDPTP